MLLFITFRSSHRRYSAKKDVLKVRKFRKSVFSKVTGLRACNFIKKKLRHNEFAKLLGIPIFTNICERLLLFFQCNFHQNFQYNNFHYHRKMQLYRRRIFLTIPLDCNIIPCLFQLNFVFFLPADIFLWSYSKLFAFYAQ